MVDSLQGTVNKENLKFQYIEANIEMSDPNMPPRMWNTNSSKLRELVKDFPEVDIPDCNNMLGLIWNTGRHFEPQRNK